MKKTDKKFYWHFETVFDHEVTPEEFEEVTGFKWEKRLEYLDRLNSDCSEYAGRSDISSLYHNRRDSEKASYYGKLSLKVPMCVDYCY